MQLSTNPFQIFLLFFYPSLFSTCLSWWQSQQEVLLVEKKTILLLQVEPGVIRIASPADDREVARGINHFDGEDVTISLQLVGLDMLAPGLEKK